MLSDLFAFVRSFARWLAASTTPAQLALGLTLGMIVGVMPKTNLIVLGLCVAIFSLRCNKIVAIATAIAFSFLGQTIDPFTHKIGVAILSIHSLQATFASVLNLPLGPWIGFNNTVVLGTFLLGLYVAYPVFWISRLLFYAIGSLWAREAYEPEVIEEERELGVAA